MNKLYNNLKTKEQWHNINWRNVNNYVAKLQLDLVVAYKNNDWEKIFFLQNKIIMSFEGKALAVRRIVTNDGRKTPGTDKVVWLDPCEKYKAISELRSIIVSKSGFYKSGPIRQVWVPKSILGEIKPLGIPNMIDRALQALIFLCLDPIVEEMSDQYSFGSRKFRGTYDAIQRIRTILDKTQGPKWLWDVDMSKCFDEISHEFLKKKLSQILCKKGNEFVSNWLKAPIVDKGVITIPKKGTLEGNILSPLLCNITLNRLENVVRDGMPFSNSKKGRKLSGSWLVRYVDDFIVTSPSKERLIEKNIPKVKKFLAERGLQVSEKKSRIVNLEKESFNFLGWTIRLQNRNLKFNKLGKNRHVLIIVPKRKAVKRVKSQIKAEFRSQKPIGALIKNLNPILRGWSNYYRTSYHSQKVFQSLGHYVYELWWKWALKKHTKRNKKWIYNTYIFKTPERSWRIGESSERLLFDVTLAKQIKVKNLKNRLNPYVDKDYYINRSITFDAEKFRKAIYKLHNFKCVACNEPLYNELYNEKIHLHHKIPKKDGGKYSLNNIIPLHATCHESITHAKKKWFNEE